MGMRLIFQIARDLQAYFPKVGISPLKLPNEGVSFRFDPINSFPGELQIIQCKDVKGLFAGYFAEHSTSLQDVDKFIEALKKRVVSVMSFVSG